MNNQRSTLPHIHEWRVSEKQLDNQTLNSIVFYCIRCKEVDVKEVPNNNPPTPKKPLPSEPIEAS